MLGGTEELRGVLFAAASSAFAFASSAVVVANSAFTVASSATNPAIRCSKWPITASRRARNSGGKGAICSGETGGCDSDMADMSLISPRARSPISCPGYPAL